MFHSCDANITQFPNKPGTISHFFYIVYILYRNSPHIEEKIVVLFSPPSIHQPPHNPHSYQRNQPPDNPTNLPGNRRFLLLLIFFIPILNNRFLIIIHSRRLIQACRLIFLTPFIGFPLCGFLCLRENRRPAGRTISRLTGIVDRCNLFNRFDHILTLRLLHLLTGRSGVLPLMVANRFNRRFLFQVRPVAAAGAEPYS